MFEWLFGSRKPAADVPATTASRPATSPTAAASSPQATKTPPAAMSDQAPVAVADSLEKTPADTNSPVEVSALMAKTITRLAVGEDAEPKVGIDAVAVTPLRLDNAKVVRVQAGGRRVMVSLTAPDSDRVRIYSRRSDGVYRLEGTPERSPARLVLGATV